MTTPKKRKERVVKAWAVFYEGELVSAFADRVTAQHVCERVNAGFPEKKVQTFAPCTITYSLPANQRRRAT